MSPRGEGALFLLVVLAASASQVEGLHPRRPSRQVSSSEGTDNDTLEQQAGEPGGQDGLVRSSARLGMQWSELPLPRQDGGGRQAPRACEATVVKGFCPIRNRAHCLNSVQRGLNHE